MRFTVNKLDNFSYQYNAQNTKKKIKISNALESIDVVGTNQNSITEQLIEFNSGEYLQKISDGCFINCNNLTSTTLQKTTSYIGNSGFRNCQNLTKINLESIIYDYIGNNAFENIGIETLNIELYKGNTSVIGDYLFSNCKKLKTVALTSNFLSKNMFSDNASLTSLNICISNDLNYSIDIDETAFSNCNNLQNITVIGQSDAFPNMSNLPKLNSVAFKSTNDNCYIAANVFSNTPCLTSIHLDKCFSNISQINNKAFAKSSVKKIFFDGICLSNLQNSTVVVEMAELYPTINDIVYDENPQQMYYGKIYSDLSAALNFSVANKIPLVVIGGQYLDRVNFRQFTDLNYKITKDWISQQPYIFCIPFQKVRNTIHTDDSTLIRNTSDSYLGVRDKGDKPQYKYSAFIFQNGKHKGLYTGTTYGGYLYTLDMDGTLEINVFDVQNSICGVPGAFSSTADSLHPVKYLAKILDGRTLAAGKRLTYDIKTKQFGEIDAEIETYKAPIECPEFPNYNLIVAIKPSNSSTTKLTTYAKCESISDITKQRSSYYSDYGWAAPLYNFPYVYPQKDETNAYTFNNVMIHEVDAIANVITFQNLRRPYIPLYDGKKVTDIKDDDPIKKEVATAYSQYVKSKTYHEAWYGSTYDVVNQLKGLERYLKNLYSDYVPDSRFYAPDYVKKDVKLEYPKERIQFNCWGIGHDCEIVTSDGHICKWTESAKKLFKVS